MKKAYFQASRTIKRKYAPLHRHNDPNSHKHIPVKRFRLHGSQQDKEKLRRDELSV